MTADRFAFQRECVEKTTGKVLNVGCKEDPAGLKSSFPERVVNLDIRDYDDAIWHTEQRKTPIPVDVIADATLFPWPFEDGAFDLVIFGDMLEDLPDDGCQMRMVVEAHRVGKHLCITTPEDSPERDAHHQTTITEERLTTWLAAGEWKVEELRTVNYGFVPRGYFVFAS